MNKSSLSGLRCCVSAVVGRFLKVRVNLITIDKEGNDSKASSWSDKRQLVGGV